MIFLQKTCKCIIAANKSSGVSKVILGIKVVAGNKHFILVDYCCAYLLSKVKVL